MSVYVYQCTKCGIVTKKDTTPTSMGCSDAPFHKWNKLGEAGTTDYVCKDCGLQVQTKATPTSMGCRGANFHHWTKL